MHFLQLFHNHTYHVQGNPLTILRKLKIANFDDILVRNEPLPDFHEIFDLTNDPDEIKNLRASQKLLAICKQKLDFARQKYLLRPTQKIPVSKSHYVKPLEIYEMPPGFWKIETAIYSAASSVLFAYFSMWKRAIDRFL